MTDQALLDLILVTPAAKLKAIAGLDNQVVADLPPQTVTQSFMLTTRGVLKTLGVAEGAAVMQALRAASKGQTPLAPVLAELLPLLDDVSPGGGVDVLLDSGILTSLVSAGLVTQAQADKITALTIVSDVITHEQVSRALRPFRSEGMVGQDNWTGA